MITQTSQSLTLAPGLEALRLTLHVLAATIWVGGQFVMLGLLPTARSMGGDATRKLAAAFGRLSWPAFAVLVLTGFWNVAAVSGQTASSAWSAVMGVKYVLVLLAGLGAWLHQRSTSKRGIAIWGAVGGLASVAALIAGVLLAG
jgi:uncharacterized membrane protein